MNDDDINSYLPSLLNPRTFKKCNGGLSLTQVTSFSNLSLSLKRDTGISNGTRSTKKAMCLLNKENQQNKLNCMPAEHLQRTETKEISTNNDVDIIDLTQVENTNTSLDNEDFNFFNNPFEFSDDIHDITTKFNLSKKDECKSVDSDKTILYDAKNKTNFSLSFRVLDSDNVDITADKSYLKNVQINRCKNDINIDCEIVEGSEVSEECIDKITKNSVCPQKRNAVAINLQIKKKKLTTDDKDENPKILILNTNDTEKLTKINVEPPNYKLVKFKNKETYSNYSIRKFVKNGSEYGDVKLKQRPIDSYFKTVKEKAVESKSVIEIKCKNPAVRDDTQEMSKNSGVVCSRQNSFKTTCSETSKSPRISLPLLSPKEAKFLSIPRASSSRTKRDSTGSLSSRRNVDQFKQSKQLKAVIQNIPHYKIVAGTHFAVDAFSYGPIPNVQHYFLTHFHSDHYSGLNRNFNKKLFCSKITADLCMASLGVNSKCIQVINMNEAIVVDGVEVTPLEANHCPGALMFVFTLPNGKTILHTGDFRATDLMESYPVFWNKDIHTVYLDTTYCNPRYNFPTQDQSLEMANKLLRKKKLALESVGKKFSSVLVVCGTYTIGKEKFFHGIAKHNDLSVWISPEKDRIMKTVEGKSYSQKRPESCQLHVVSMRDLTYEKLRSYLSSLKGAFSEVVAFKPSGWENEKNTVFEKDCVTIHGIPYSEHSSFSELIRFVKFLKPKQVVPTVCIPGGIKSVQKYFPCPLLNKEDIMSQSRVTDYFSMQNCHRISVP